MRTIQKLSFIVVISMVTLLWSHQSVISQTIPDVFEEGILEEQYSYLHDRTNIYNNFRAIREDMFQRIRRNSLDSLNRAKREIGSLKMQETRLMEKMDSLENAMTIAKSERDQAIRDRDSLFLFGIGMNKTFYNLLLWSIIGGLAALMVIVFLMFKRASVVSHKTKTEFKELRQEYEEYRKTSRERFEQQSIDHFNEIKRLKGL